MADFDLRNYDPLAGSGWGQTSSRENVAHRVLISSICQVLTRVDRTLSSRSDVRVSNECVMPGCPAATVGGKDIKIDFSHEAFKHYVGDEAFMHVLGLNYHEEAHVMFTPVLTSMPKVYGLVQNEGNPARFAFNALEDGRIERLIGGEYGAVRGYLLNTFAIMAGLTNDPDSLWAITAPRHQELPDYVTDAIRVSVVQSGKFSESQMDSMTKIAKRYNGLVLPRDDVKAAKCIRDYMLILGSVFKSTPDDGMHSGGNMTCTKEGHTTGDGGKRGEKQSEQAQEEAPGRSRRGPRKSANGRPKRMPGGSPTTTPSTAATIGDNADAAGDGDGDEERRCRVRGVGR